MLRVIRSTTSIGVIAAVFSCAMALTPLERAGAASNCFETPDGTVCFPAVPEPVIFAGIDPTPPTDPSLIDVPPTGVVTAKEEQSADFTAQGDQLLTIHADESAPDDASMGAQDSVVATCADATDCGGGAAPSHYGLSVLGRQQEQEYWCVPAVAEMTLSSMGASDPGQTELAKEMHTSNGGAHPGTVLAYAVKPINRRATRNYYQWKTDTDSPSQLLGRAMTDIWRYKSTYLIAIDVSSIGFYPAYWGGSHAVDNYAYYTQSGGGLYVFDPMNPTFTGGETYYGKHNVALHRIYASMHADGAGIVW